jgi:hypothetical protein
VVVSDVARDVDLAVAVAVVVADVEFGSWFLR